MFRLMKNEWKKIWIPVLLTLIVVTVAACTMTATMYPDYSLTYTLDAWEVGTEYLSLLYPLFVVLPVCWNASGTKKQFSRLCAAPCAYEEIPLGQVDGLCNQRILHHHNSVHSLGSYGLTH